MNHFKSGDSDLLSAILLQVQSARLVLAVILSIWDIECFLIKDNLTKQGLSRTHHQGSLNTFGGEGEESIQKRRNVSKPVKDIPKCIYQYDAYSIWCKNSFTEEAYHHNVQKTIRYATKQKRNRHFMWQLKTKIFIGVLTLSGYHRLLSECDSWSDGEDLGVQIVIDTISRNRYIEIKFFLYFPK